MATTQDEEFLNRVPEAARRLRLADQVMTVIALIGVAGGLISLLLSAVILPTRDRTTDWAAVMCSIATIASGVVFWGLGAALRMLAAIGIAVASSDRRGI